MGAVTILPAGTYTGSVVLGPMPIPAGATFVDVLIDRTNWTDQSTALNGAAEVSLDGGATWQSIGGIGAPGGAFVLRGKLVTQGSASFGLPDAANANRQLRATMVCTGSVPTSIAADFR